MNIYIDNAYRTVVITALEARATHFEQQLDGERLARIRQQYQDYVIYLRTLAGQVRNAADTPAPPSSEISCVRCLRPMTGLTLDGAASFACPYCAEDQAVLELLKTLPTARDIYAAAALNFIVVRSNPDEGEAIADAFRVADQMLNRARREK